MHILVSFTVSITTRVPATEFEGKGVICDTITNDSHKHTHTNGKIMYFFLTADSKAAMYLNIIYGFVGFVGLVGLLVVLAVSFACYKIFKR